MKKKPVEFPQTSEGLNEWLCWPVQPKDLVLNEHMVHVWSFSLQQPPSDRLHHEQTLPPDEQERAARLTNQQVRDRFVIARIRLRELLSLFLRRPPQKIYFTYGPQGKPSIISEVGEPQLTFNLAHSGGIGLIAIGLNREVGVDHERRKRFPDAMGIAERFFSQAEVSYIRSLPSNQREEEFLKIWTCKEAYVKAVGSGLSCPLDSFAVTFSTESERGVVVSGGESLTTLEYSIQLLPASRLFFGAVVSTGQDWKLNCWHWPDINQ